jgi:tetratricopeptide (TPR) repeat protein
VQEDAARQPPRFAFSKRLRALGLPFPRWLALALGGTLVTLVVLTYVLAALVGHADWADAARAAGIAAFALAGILAAGTVARLALGRRGRQMLVGAFSAVLVLTALGSGGLILSQPLHHLQASTAERNDNWLEALREYALSGETPPDAPDIARVLDERGEQSLANTGYQSAITDFTSVTTLYAGSGAAVGRANHDILLVYSAWLQSAGSDFPYDKAIAFLAYYQADVACDASCRSIAATLEAQALYQYGLALDAQQDYDVAIVEFEIVQARFPSSTYASLAHAAAAKAHYARGKSALLGGFCQAAIPDFQTLASRYGDTGEGQIAKVMLEVPVTVTGTITGFPKSPAPTIALSRTAHAPRYGAPAPNGSFSFSDDYTTPLNVATGQYTFARVVPGLYTISTFVSGLYTTWWYAGDDVHLLFLQVGPLCATTLAPLPDYPFPS